MTIALVLQCKRAIQQHSWAQWRTVYMYLFCRVQQVAS